MNVLSVTFLKKWEYTIRHTEEMIRYEKDFRNTYLVNELEYDDKKGKAVSVEYTRGKNYDRDLEKAGGEFSIKLREEWTVTYNFDKYWFRPARSDDNSAGDRLHDVLRHSI